MVIKDSLKLYLLTVIILFTIVAMTAGDAFALWYSSNWGFRQKITIDSVLVPGDLSNFPVLVSVTDTNLIAVPGGNVGKTNGGDIFFTNASGTMKLNHEKVLYNSVTGEFTAWVMVPNVSSASDTELYIYYGNPGAVDQWETDGSTWDVNYTGVWHLDETVTDESIGSVHKDSTYNDNGVQNNNATASGQILSGQDFDGSGDWVQIDKTSIIFTDFTYSAWINTSVIPLSGNWDTIIDLDNDKQLLALEDSSYNIWGRCGNINHGSAAAGWHHIVWSVTGSNYILYEDGIQIGSGGGCAANRTGQYIMIGSGLGGNEYFNGVIDEVRVSNTGRTPDWIIASFFNQNAPASFIALGAQEIFVPAPAMNSRGMIIFIILAGIVSLYYLRRKKIKI